MHRFALALLLALTACGPDDEYTPPPTTKPPPAVVSPDFAGRWVGTAVMSAPGQAPYQQDGVPLLLNTSGQTLVVSGVCPDGSGSYAVTGQGRTLSWSGEVSCTYASPGCSVTTRRYTSAVITLSPDNTLTINGNGLLFGCGASFNITHGFTGRK